MIKAAMLGISTAVILSTGAFGQTISIGSSPQGSLNYAAAAAVSTVSNQAANLKARAIPQGGPIVTLPLVNNSELDFSITNAVNAYFAFRGTSTFKSRGKQENIRVVAALFPLEMAWFVRKDSDIKTISDLKGKRISSKLSKQKSILLQQRAMLATVGLSVEDAVGVPTPNGERQLQDFMSGKIDAYNYSLSSGLTKQAHAKVGVRALSLPDTPAALKALRKHAPGSRIENRNPNPKYGFITAPTNIMVVPFLIMSSAKVSDEIVYKVTKAIFENQKKLIASHKVFLSMEKKKLHVDVGVPYHAGAVKFYKEMGL